MNEVVSNQGPCSTIPVEESQLTFLVDAALPSEIAWKKIHRERVRESQREREKVLKKKVKSDTEKEKKEKKVK